MSKLNKTGPERKTARNLRTVPEFASDDDERAFWETHDSTDYLDWSKAQNVVLPNLKPSIKTIPLRQSKK
ncbi:MAG: hypothetical protein H7Z39_00710 [Burkholderiaceae bacterium]|nr:hypothetical protein [Burkholderiaceae bacterium]